MDCKTTSTSPGRRRAAGAGLIEFIIALALGAMVLLAMFAILSYSGRCFAAMVNYCDLDKQSRHALDTMSQEIRRAQQLTGYATNQLVFLDHDGQTLTYSYNPVGRTLTRTKGLDTRVLLKECDTLTFGIFQRNPVGGAYDVYPTATVATCKLVQMSWICSRTILGLKMNTESVQSAKVVIRNQ
jgi:hypothetical protein